MIRIAVRAIIEKEGKLLLVKLKSYKIDSFKEFYCTIGGGLDEGESIVECLNREVIEETGIVPVIGSLLYVQQYADKHDNIEFFFHVPNASDFEVVKLEETTHGSKEIKEIGFFELDGITILPEFLKTIDLKTLNEITTPIFFNYL